jgi:hypothetical protein
MTIEKVASHFHVNENGVVARAFRANMYEHIFATSCCRHKLCANHRCAKFLKIERIFNIVLASVGGTFVARLDISNRAAADRFKWGELDFVYIDANHEYEHVLEDVRAWAPKVRAGGIVSGHDYAGDVEKAVLEHCRQAGIPVLFVWRNDRSASWSFIQI